MQHVQATRRLRPNCGDPSSSRHTGAATNPSQQKPPSWRAMAIVRCSIPAGQRGAQPCAIRSSRRASGRSFRRRRGIPFIASPPPVLALTWGVSGQAHSFAPAAGVSPAKRGEAQRSRERSDLDAPAAGYTVTSERALARSWLPLWSLPRSFILALRISFGVWIRSVSPSFACSLDGRITSHPVELVGARTIIPHARGRRARVGGDHPVKRRVSARQSRGHRPPGSGEAVAFGFAGMGLSR